MDDLSSVEQQVLQKLFEFREKLPKPRPGQKIKNHDELTMLDELVQVRIVIHVATSPITLRLEKAA